MKKRYAGFTFVFLMLMSVTHAARNIDHVTLKLAWKHQFQFAGYYMAKEKGFYKEENIDVDFIEHNNRDIYKEVAAGKVDFIAIGPAAVNYYLDGYPLVTLGVIFQQSPRAWLSLSSKKLETKKDFTGKRFAMLKRNQLTETTALLKEMGLRDEDIIVSPVSFGVDEIIKDKVDFLDAYVSNEPFALVEKNIAYNERRPIDYGMDFYGDALYTSKKLTDSNPELVERFRKASLKGWKYAFEHIEETVDVILRNYNQTLNKRREALLFEARQLLRLSGYPSVKLGSMSIERWHRNAMLFNPKRPISEKEIEAFIFASPNQSLPEWLKIVLIIFVIATLGLLSLRLKRSKK